MTDTAAPVGQDTAAALVAELTHEIGTPAHGPSNVIDSRLVPRELLERVRAALEDAEREGARADAMIAGAHVTTIIDEAEHVLRAVLDDRPNVEVLALMRFAVIDDRGGMLVACAGAPPPDAIAKMGAVRQDLAKGLRAVANAIDPPE